MNTSTLSKPVSFWQSLSKFDWVYAILLLAGAVFSYQRYAGFMDIYEVSFLFGAVAVFSYLGWRWSAIARLVLGVAVLSLIGVYVYQGDLSQGGQRFLLKFLLASQSAIMWMNVLFVLAMLTYWLAMFQKSEFTAKVASALTWTATLFGFVGLMVRWYESYLIAPDIGHIPISNLYEVFILFCLITALLYLHYEQLFKTRQLGGFVLVVINAAVGFILWYTFDRHANEIQPLVPALQSYWMKIHVPANFIGYGAFSLAAMVAGAYLLAKRGILASRLPAPHVLDDLMYKAIAVGFAFFTIATILGAMWAAEAWGGYWSWDPKETWALIVWLNYAAWLHLRLMKGLRGSMLAWWALVGLLVTTFAFLGVNMFLSGLHSYGTL
ncbi:MULTISPECIES: c-type cytochrome biogenesis protein CcsB [unclassified Methylophilus]|jgi:cytochrome c-type biogenesis protein CcsB|uniref:c-type cytochrome biogenesis protein CcsB n=1 Tax=unclassified Methylophilus TaxID=2630143 RepID=UPI00188F2729|nr:MULTISPECIES: c-type cytochrome biogenesis protein CcsB [unclassified Methylophilus]MBF5039717.1 c-type cytochrome biogenesis protein CcsB [Methylophilus sp. 13]MDF0379156.1 c-type cytochrome biogenesis protein CcsB [Methylophilus sp. YYY-1]MDT7848911.1 c-type cytochrome biogenesis protein CcsB [Methylophilus sp. VKM B-3414]BEV09146.1 c-type cytochrome biogenesis protein CcsB [Methylophilus sp. DW102]